MSSQPMGYYSNPRYFLREAPDYRHLGERRAASGRPREPQRAVQLHVLSPVVGSLSDEQYEQYLDGYISHYEGMP